MKWKSSSRTLHVTTIVLITVLIGLIGMNSSVVTNKTIIPCSTAASPTIPWNITLRINESGGAGNTVVFGEETNASHGQDGYDRPAPPIPPILPAITAWFETPFPPPFTKLIYEFKPSSSIYTSWNLSILWLPAPGNITSTSITIHWDSSQLLKNPNITLFLYENNTILTNMLTTNSYSYVTNDTLHSFQIISQNQPSNNPPEQNIIPILPLLIFILVLFMAIFIVFLFLNKKKKKSYEKWKEEKTSFQINEKPKTNIKQKANEKPTTKKKPQTKRKPTKKHKR